MIWIAPLVMLLVFVAIEIHVLRLVDGDAHERCLKNIGRLESKLFPDLPVELRWAPWPPRSSVQSRPAIWTVSSHDDIQPVFNYVEDATQTVKQEWLEDEARYVHLAATAAQNGVVSGWCLTCGKAGPPHAHHLH